MTDEFVGARGRGIHKRSAEDIDPHLGSGLSPLSYSCQEKEVLGGDGPGN